MHLLCLSFHHIKTKYANFQRARFEDPSKFYEISKSLKECVLIQTGTRVEVYALIEDKEREVNLLLNLFSSRAGIEKHAIVDFFKVYFDEEAAVHLFRLVGCTESRVFGETYIPRKVEHTFHLAQENSATGPFMELLFNSAIRVGKRARSETKIDGSLPVENIAVRYIIEEFKDLKGKNVLLFGSGLTGKKVAKELKKYNPKSIVAVNRNYDISTMTAKEIGANAVKYEELKNVLSRASVLICATLASHYRVTPDMITSLGRTSPLVVVDVSPFGNVDPAVAKLPNIILKDRVLSKAIEKNMKIAEAEVPKVEKIIEEEIEHLNELLRESKLELSSRT